MTPGRLRLADGRLSFANEAGEVLLDAAVGELHSVATSLVGLAVWKGDNRYRFSFGKSKVRLRAGSGLVGSAAAIAILPQAASELNDGLAYIDTWVETLTPLIGPAPQGQRHAKPWGQAAMFTLVFGIMFAALVIFFAILYATQ